MTDYNMITEQILSAIEDNGEKLDLIQECLDLLIPDMTNEAIEIVEDEVL